MTETLKTKYALSTSRLAVLTIFFVNGAGFFNWATRIPQVQENLSLSAGSLGLALLGISVGVVTGLFFAGGLIARFSSRTVTTIASIGFSLAFIPVGLASNYLTLVLTLLFFGFNASIMDMAMNTQAAEVERRAGKPMMSSFHAAFSVGGIAGSLMGAAAVGLSFSVLTHFSIIAILFLIVIAFARLPMLTIQGETDSAETEPVVALPHPAVWALGAVAFSAAIGEGSMIDWSAVYMKEIVGTTESVAAYGLIAFSTTMTGGRLLGDWIALKFGAEMLVRGGGLLGTIGLLLALIFPQTPVVLFGFALVGAGMSLIIPLAFSAAGNLPDISSSKGIAGVATIGYAGFLAGPPMIGLFAQFTSYRIALTFVLILMVTLFFTGRSIAKANMPKAK